MPPAATEKSQPPRPSNKRFWWLLAAFFLAALVAIILLRRCGPTPPPPIPPAAPPALEEKDTTRGSAPAPVPAPPAGRPAVKAPPPAEPALPPAAAPKPAPETPPVAAAPPKDTAKPAGAMPADSIPYVYAEPWGGRHFDSVTVSLRCRESCVVVYSLEDSVHFQSYADKPLTFRRNTSLWIAGLDAKARQSPPVRVDYVIEKSAGVCKENSMPVPVAGKTVCVDAYEWPNREGSWPRASVSRQAAEDSCVKAGKRLCALEEWRAACQGPDRENYPYGGDYNEGHCPAKEPSASRSGRFPACRSYYGVYDMSGNLWEWTSTPAKDRADFFMVAGGNWDAGGDATCGLSKYSFYPQNRYPFVGFRCCRDASSGP